MACPIQNHIDHHHQHQSDEVKDGSQTSKTPDGSGSSGYVITTSGQGSVNCTQHLNGTKEQSRSMLQTVVADKERNKAFFVASVLFAQFQYSGERQKRNTLKAEVVLVGGPLLSFAHPAKSQITGYVHKFVPLLLAWSSPILAKNVCGQ